MAQYLLDPAFGMLSGFFKLERGPPPMPGTPVPPTLILTDPRAEELCLADVLCLADELCLAEVLSLAVFSFSPKPPLPMLKLVKPSSLCRVMHHFPW
jgi:hypothetical protein